jgi:alanine-glyoxylate transaminase/serine-glyoxylate transaminase/serine-pyruvate transaminase
MAELYPTIPERKLMGPGPLNVHPRVLQALGLPVLSHLDPAYLQAMDEVRERLRGVFATKNQVTHATPGTGTSGMEACVANLLEPGDRIVVCVQGYFGDRIRQMAERQEADVRVVEGEWGKPADPADVEAALKEAGTKVLGLVHAETSTGVLQPMDDIAALAKEHGAMILMDAVTSLGGVDVKTDEWGVDAAYSCSQKCIGCPSGLAPVTFSTRAIDSVERRKHPVRTWYLDIDLLEKYWDSRVYHHTSSSTLNFALLEALRLIDEEGLANRIARHKKNHLALVAGVEAMGLRMHVDAEYRLPTLNTIQIPEGVDDATARGYLLETFNLEIGGGLGALKGKVWRVGLMGYSSSPENVAFFLSAITSALSAQGKQVDLNAGLSAAMSSLGA